MLIEFRVKNFRSFKDEQVLSMVASSDKELPNNVVEAGKLRLLKTAAIYGPNASGKSNLIWAFYVMNRIIKESASGNPILWPKSMAPFLLAEENEKQPMSFEVVFYQNDIRYQYGFSLLAPSMLIIDEWLNAYPESKRQKWIERHFDINRNITAWNPGKKLKGDIKNLQDKTRDSSLFLTVANQWNNEQLKPVYEWFNGSLQIAPDDSQIKPITTRMLADSENTQSMKESFKKYLLSFLENADMGIDDINAHTMTPTVKMPGEFSPEVKTNPIKEMTETRIETVHRITSISKDIHFNLNDESSGTQKLFDLAGPWLIAVSTGVTLIIDEIDTSLHPLLTRGLIGFFQSPTVNSRGAQLIFTTHDTTLLDPELMRRDQIWFIEKDESAASHLYSLSDYKKLPRKDAAFQKNYLSGRYGAIPILKAFGINKQA